MRAPSFVDRYGDKGSIYDVDFVFYPDWQARMAEVDAGLYEIDHLTHNVQRGNMDVWSNFYERIGNFREIRYFDIEGKLTGLHSRAMIAPCGKIRIPINESSDDKSQIEEYLRQYKGRDPAHRHGVERYLPHHPYPAWAWYRLYADPGHLLREGGQPGRGAPGGSGGAQRAAHPH